MIIIFYLGVGVMTVVMIYCLSTPLHEASLSHGSALALQCSVGQPGDGGSTVSSKMLHLTRGHSDTQYTVNVVHAGLYLYLDQVFLEHLVTSPGLLV